MTLYLNENIKIDELVNGFLNKNIFAAKLYLLAQQPTLQVELKK